MAAASAPPRVPAQELNWDVLGCVRNASSLSSFSPKADVGFDSYLATNPLETSRNSAGFVKGFGLMGRDERQMSDCNNHYSLGRAG